MVKHTKRAKQFLSFKANDKRCCESAGIICYFGNKTRQNMATNNKSA